MREVRSKGRKAVRAWGYLTGLFLALVLVLPASAGAWAAGSEAGVRLLRSDGQGIVLEVLTPGYEVEERVVNGAACQRIHVPGAVQSAEAGHPQLPLRILLLGVPPESELTLEVSPLETVPVPGSFAICPAPAAVAEQGEGELLRYVERETTPDPAIYGRDDLYPSQAALVSELGFLRSQRIARLEVSPFQVHPLSGQLYYHRRLRVALHFGGRPGALAAAPREPDEFEAALRSVLVNYEAARSWRAGPHPPLPLSGGGLGRGWTPPQPGYKLMVTGDGLYKLDRAALAAAGLPVDTLDPRTLRLFNGGQEVAIRVLGEEDGRFDEGDLVLFYGQGADTVYTGTNVYWLTCGGAVGRRMAERLSQPEGDTAASFSAAVHLEENKIYISGLPMEEDAHHWYNHPPVQAAGPNPAWRDYPFTVQHLATTASTATLQVSLAGNYNGVHHLRLYVNGHQVHDDSWAGRTVYQAAADFPQGYLNEGSNTIRVELANDTPGQSFDQVYVDWLRVLYQRTYVAAGDRLAFGGDQAGTWQYHVSGFSSPDIAVYEVTDPANVSVIAGVTVSPENGSYTLHFGDSHDGGRRYLALTAAQRLTPPVELDTPSALQSPTAGADYLIVSHGSFLTAIRPLADHRAAQGLRVQVVDVQDVYDEFGYGLVSAQAIHDFLIYAYEHWPRPAPTYVLLVGDGTYDPRRYLPSSAPTYVPPYLRLVDPMQGETATDNRYACVSGEDIVPDLHIGRLPANSPAEAEAMVNKTLSYETSPAAGDWNRNVLFIADDPEGGGGNFYALSDNIADGYADPPANTIKFLPQPYSAIKVYLGQTCAKENPSLICRQHIVDAINSGALLTSFIGHATKTYWAAERLLDIAALSRLNNADRLTIALPMTCLEGYFHEAAYEAFGEADVRLPGGGAVASWSPTGLGLASGHDLLEQGLFLALFRGGVQELGAATTAGKLYLLANSPAGKYDDLVETYTLLGDPALRVYRAGPEGAMIFLPLLTRGSRP
ncbi:MAG: C25 family cysteine peptidase [Anaerolineae bacterium]|nr:C25 family cysteine peptidase [Anaerolineae bacterium]